MTSSTDPMGQTTSYTYNNFGQLTSVTDPQGNTNTSGYDDKDGRDGGRSCFIALLVFTWYIAAMPRQARLDIPRFIAACHSSGD